MRYEIIENFTIRTSKGEHDLFTGQKIELSEDAAAKLLEIGKIKPEPEANRTTLEMVMGDMVQATCDRIIEEHKKRGIASYVSNSETKLTEDKITRIYHNALRGQASITEFQNACKKWESLFIKQD